MSLPFHKSLIKHLAVTALLCTPFIAAKCQAGTISQQYVLQQEHITTVTAPKSELVKASCQFFDNNGKRIAAQNVTVLTEYKEQGLNVIEAQLYYEQHNAIVSVKCK